MFESWIHPFNRKYCPKHKTESWWASQTDERKVFQTEMYYLFERGDSQDKIHKAETLNFDKHQQKQELSDVL